MFDGKKFHRFLDVIERDIVPLTAGAVEIGCKVFGAAVLRKNLVPGRRFSFNADAGLLGIPIHTGMRQKGH